MNDWEQSQQAQREWQAERDRNDREYRDTADRVARERTERNDAERLQQWRDERRYSKQEQQSRRAVGRSLPFENKGGIGGKSSDTVDAGAGIAVIIIFLLPVAGLILLLAFREGLVLIIQTQFPRYDLGVDSMFAIFVGTMACDISILLILALCVWWSRRNKLVCVALVVALFAVGCYLWYQNSPIFSAFGHDNNSSSIYLPSPEHPRPKHVRPRSSRSSAAQVPARQAR